MFDSCDPHAREFTQARMQLGCSFLLQDIDIHEYNLLKNKYTPIRHKGQKLRECETKSLETTAPDHGGPLQTCKGGHQGAMGGTKVEAPVSWLSPDCYTPTLGFNNPRAVVPNTPPHSHLGLSQSEGPKSAAIGGRHATFYLSGQRRGEQGRH